MPIKIVLISLVTILIPTTFLSYFGLLAVRSEKTIIEQNMKEKYEFMADIVIGEIQSSLSEIPEGLLENRRYLESVLTGEALMFKDQILILDTQGKAVNAQYKSFDSENIKKKLENAVLTRQIPGLPYTIVVHEQYPLSLTKKLEQKKRGFFIYLSIIIFSALSILGGGFFTLCLLSNKWRFAELKSEFVSSLSHDLRKPLTSIRMFSEMLMDNRIPAEEKKAEYINIIHKQSERLTHLTNNVLDFSRIERGRKRYDFKPTDIVKLAADTVNWFKGSMADNAREIKFDAQGSFPLLNIDKDAISQALINLISNADKFSPPDKQIKVNLSRVDRHIIIEVIDQGIGIPLAEQKKIFHEFYRSSQDKVKEVEGSGLGLLLVKYIVEAHKGRIKVESEEGKGSKFIMVLPGLG